MKCPRCNNLLQQVKNHNTEVDACIKCNGMWFDSGELTTYLDCLKKEDIPEAQITLETPIAKKNIKEKPKDCPRCGIQLNLINYAYDSNIILDKCNKCGGLWVDEGEIIKLATYIKGNPKLTQLASSICNDFKNDQKRRELIDGLTEIVAPSGPLAIAFLPRVILPIHDNIKSKTFPSIVLSIIAVNIITHLYQAFFVDSLQSFFWQYGLIPSSIYSGSGYHSLFTHMFLHAGFLHLIFNMFFFWIFADNIEDAFGHPHFIIVYFFFGLSAVLSHIIIYSNSQIPVIGASGAISGIMGSYFVLYPYAKIKLLYLYKIISVPAILFLGGWIVFQILFGIISSSLSIFTGVAWFAHIGGFIAGAVTTYFYKKYFIKDGD